MKTIKHTLSKMATVVLISSFLAIGCSDDSVTNPPIAKKLLISTTLGHHCKRYATFPN